MTKLCTYINVKIFLNIQKHLNMFIFKNNIHKRHFTTMKTFINISE